MGTLTKGWLAFDIEVADGKLYSLAVADPDGKDVFAACWRASEIPQWVWDVLADPEVGLIEHTLYDATTLSRLGYRVAGPIADTRVMSWNVDENASHKLEDCALRFLGRQMDKRLTESGKKFVTDEGKAVPLADAPWEQVRRYNLDDAKVTADLYNTLLPRQPEYWDKQVELTSVLHRMEISGLPIDENKLDQMRAYLISQADELTASLTSGLPASFNLNSGDQVAALLFLKKFDLPGRIRNETPLPPEFHVEKVGRLWTTGYTTVEGFNLKPTKWTDSEKRPKVDAKSLVKYAEHPWVSLYLQYQKIDKILSFLNSWPEYIRNGRLYGRFNQGGTVTGRLSSSNPNLQNLPRRGEFGAQVRQLFAGQLIVADFSQLEPRIAAHVSGDPALLRVYEEGLDIYKDLGSYVFDLPYDEIYGQQRDTCKTLVLGMNYGAQAKTVAEQLTLAGYPTTPKQAGRYLERMVEKYAVFFEWREQVIREARVNGFVRTIAGRKRNLQFDHDQWRVERQAVNSIIQGSAADIVEGTMLLIGQMENVRILAQVHDELVMEYIRRRDEDLEHIQWAGETGHGYALKVPLVFEPKFCETWGDK